MASIAQRAASRLDPVMRNIHGNSIGSPSAQPSLIQVDQLAIFAISQHRAAHGQVDDTSFFGRHFDITEQPVCRIACRMRSERRDARRSRTNLIYGLNSKYLMFDCLPGLGPGRVEIRDAYG